MNRTDTVTVSTIYVGPRKKNKELNKKSQKVLYFSYLPRSPRGRIFTKFGSNVPPADVINSDKLCVNLFTGFDFTGGQSFILPIGN